ncbi:MAG: selenocysteine-specific elongation factor [Thermomicrobiales bacterium]|nr:selenocysteine-specific elongation factor [Thermomicrobiales bacterium]
MTASRSSQTYVVGTAGHVDHGKSTLVKALTGIDPDRLAEEKARQMTIDLGFAHLTLPSGRQIGIVDVPGHERFIKNMLAGVGGIDAAMLVIAADEGPMPQTREHLAILDLLEVGLGVVVLTKTDAVDAEWLDLVSEEVREQLAGTVLAGAPIVPVSALRGEGLPELVGILDKVLESATPWPGGGAARLPIDRVFSVAGFGTVVTGTLLGGELAVGQELRLLPRDVPTRVRGLQTHGAKVERAQPGSRLAVNVANLSVEELRRGDLLTAPGVVRATQRIDVQIRLLDDAPVALKQNDQVDFFVGAAEVPAWLTLLDREEIVPGEKAWVQLRFREPVAVLRGDRFIVRRPSPSVTIGGGLVIDPAPPRHKRFRPEVLSALETLAVGSPDEIVLQELEEGPREVRALRAAHPAGLSEEQIDAALETLSAEGDIRVLGGGAGLPKPGSFVVATTTWLRLSVGFREAVAAFHAAQPLRRGMPKEELKSRVKLPGPPRLFDDVLATAVRDGVLADDGQTVRLPNFSIVLDARRRGLADRYLAALTAEPHSPPAPTEFGVDGETLGALVDRGEVVKVAEGVIFAPDAYAAIEREVLALIDREGSVTLAGFRDHFGTSRKYAQATLEYLDQRRVTRRVGDERVRYVGVGSAGRAGGGQ